MCGIAGVLRQPANGNVKSMIEKLAHRGPDGHGVKELRKPPSDMYGSPFWMSRVDINPCNIEDTWIAFNGEIYNYRKLQAKYLSDANL
jgi:asparagine synthetase B (glutamine-hydrolysing)